MLRKLQWPTLRIRRLISRLKISLHNLVTLEMPTYITTNHHHLKSNKIPTPSSLQHTYQQPELANYYHNSLKTIHDWHSLPICVIEADSINCFSSKLAT